MPKLPTHTGIRGAPRKSSGTAPKASTSKYSPYVIKVKPSSFEYRYDEGSNQPHTVTITEKVMGIKVNLPAKYIELLDEWSIDQTGEVASEDGKWDRVYQTYCFADKGDALLMLLTFKQKEVALTI